ncbi:MAG TPA: hypothetical protein PKD73_06190 [Burkholderiaceae bacterium]|nr:hypothetical protein [Burkholderiaceae bacterium]
MHRYRITLILADGSPLRLAGIFASAWAAFEEAFTYCDEPPCSVRVRRLS